MGSSPICTTKHLTREQVTEQNDYGTICKDYIEN
jgi:hypothetical protein